MAASTASTGLMEALVCDVCLEMYSSGPKTPLVLPCGHTFCRECLVSLTGSQPFLCPTCRVRHSVQVEVLSVNYSLLRITPLSHDPEGGECTTHGDILHYWCSTCTMPLCSLCLHSGHPQEHTVKLTHVSVQEEKNTLVEKIKTHSRTLKDQENELKEDVSDLDKWMKKLLRRNASLRATAADLEDLRGKVQKATNMTSIKNLEKEIRNFHCVIDLQGETTEPLLNRQQELLSYIQELQTRPGRSAMVDYCDGRVVLCCLSKTIRTILPHQATSEVFLELTAGGRRLGNVYITLWMSEVLAHHFQTLCMGTMESNSLDIKASHKIGNTVVFRCENIGSLSEGNIFGSNSKGLYNRESRRISSSPEPLVKGYVVGIEVDRKLAFGFCTENETSRNNSTPFGEVSSGLDAAIDAFKVIPVTEVTVSCCGLVLSGPALAQPPPQRNERPVPSPVSTLSHQPSPQRNNRFVSSPLSTLSHQPPPQRNERPVPSPGMTASFQQMIINPPINDPYHNVLSGRRREKNTRTSTYQSKFSDLFTRGDFD